MKNNNQIEAKSPNRAVKTPKDIITKSIRKEMDKCEAFYKTYTLATEHNQEQLLFPMLVLKNNLKHVENYREGRGQIKWKVLSEDKYLFLKLIIPKGKQLNFYFNLDDLFDRMWLKHAIVHRKIVLTDEVTFKNNSFITCFGDLPLGGLMEELIKSKYYPLIVNNLDEVNNFLRTAKKVIDSEMNKGDLTKKEHFPYIN